MARTVEEVNTNLTAVNNTINTQRMLIKTMEKLQEQNEKEYEALKRQKEALEKTSEEFSTMCSYLISECDAMYQTYQSSNGFAAGFAGHGRDQVELVNSRVQDKLLDMVERIQNQMGNNITAVQDAIDKIKIANDKIINAQNEMLVLKQELQDAETEAALQAATGA